MTMLFTRKNDTKIFTVLHGLKRHYYKTVNVPAKYETVYVPDQLKEWTQPVLTSNTSYGTVSASSRSTFTPALDYYKALDGKTSGGEGANTWWNADKYVRSGWWKWELPVTLKITSIKFYARGFNNAKITARFYTSEEKNTPMGDQFSCNTVWQTIDIAGIPVEGIKTNCIYVDIIDGGGAVGQSDGGGYVGIGEIQITAKELIQDGYSYEQLVHEAYSYETEVSESDDYDRYEDIPEYFGIEMK